MIYGLEAAEAVFAQLDPEARFERLVQRASGARGRPVLAVEGSARALLTGERTALNFLAHLSGVATMAARAARAVRGDRREGARHAQDDAGAARAGEGGGRGRGGEQPPRRACTTRS